LITEDGFGFKRKFETISLIEWLNGRGWSYDVPATKFEVNQDLSSDNLTTIESHLKKSLREVLIASLKERGTLDAIECEEDFINIVGGVFFRDFFSFDI